MSESAPRLAYLPGALADLVGRVGESESVDCLRMLSISVIDVAALGVHACVRDTLTQWREQGRISPATRSQLESSCARYEVEAARAHRETDIDAQRAAFIRARALHCLLEAVATDRPASYRLAEVAYEAMIVMGAASGVVAVLVEFVV